MADNRPDLSLETVDMRERQKKAKWHYDRVGKHPGASFKKGIANDYEGELLRRGVKNSQGEQTPMKMFAFRD